MKQRDWPLLAGRFPAVDREGSAAQSAHKTYAHPFDWAQRHTSFPFSGDRNSQPYRMIGLFFKSIVPPPVWNEFFQFDCFLSFQIQKNFNFSAVLV